MCDCGFVTASRAFAAINLLLLACSRRPARFEASWSFGCSGCSRSASAGARSSSPAAENSAWSPYCSSNERTRLDRPSGRRVVGRPAAGERHEDAPRLRLRKSLGAERLTTTHAGYSLRVEPGELDTDEFERLADAGRSALHQGDVARAERLLADALAWLNYVDSVGRGGRRDASWHGLVMHG